MSIGESVSYCLIKAPFKLSGRASRSQFWWYFLFFLVVDGAIGTFSGIMIHEMGGRGFFSFILYIFGLYLSVSMLFCLGRRLHDVGKSAWNVLWLILPVIGYIYLAIVCCRPSEIGDNRYGPEPQW